MPSWVAPGIAAELGGVSVEHVLAEVAAGRLATEPVCGLLFVDMAPFSVGFHAEAKPAGRRPLTWSAPGWQSVVTADEHAALRVMDDVAVAAAQVVEAATPPGDESDEPLVELPESVHDDAEPPPLEDGPEDATDPRADVPEEPPQWESIRARVGRTRRPPGRTLQMA